MLARGTDLVCLTIAATNDDLPDAVSALGLRTFRIPLDLPPIEIGMAWHPTHDADPAHRWFRGHIRSTLTRREAQPAFGM